MAVKYVGVKRIQGTASERTATSLPIGSVAGWKEIGRTTLGSSADDITVSSLPDKRYYMVLTNILNSGYIDGGWRFNGDTGSNYSGRRSYQGNADTTIINQTYAKEGAGDPCPNLWVSYISNKSDKEKLAISHQVMQNTAGAGNVPIRMEHYDKWSNTSDAINSITQHNGSAGSFATGSEVVVLGYDPTDTHTTNFWEELADVTLGSSATTLGTGTFTAKKYLWFQTYVKSGNIDYRITFNGDSGSNYATRWSENGGTDATSTSAAFNYLSPQGASTPRFTNTFMINNSANEKLGITHVALQNTAGAGNAPERDEVVHKWTNTSAQITSLTVHASINTLSAGTRIKVWGSD